MGTRLQALTGNPHACIDAFNLDSTFSEIVKLVHRSYLEAGADFILTNTYGANAVKLERYAKRSLVAAINLEGARLARAAAGEARMVGGSVGPLEVYPNRDEYSEDDLQRIFDEQMSALVEGGVDFLLLETFQDLLESRCALAAAAGQGVPFVFSVGGVQNGRTGTGAEAQEIVMLAADAGATAVGCNCRGPYDILETTQLLAEVTALPLLAMPNAGSPEIDRGRVVYHVTPDHFRSYARQLVDAGAAIIGGCCGTGPEHIAELADELRGHRPPPLRAVSTVRVSRVQAQTPSGERPVNRVSEALERLPFVVSVEMRPGRTTPLSEFLADGRRLAQEGVHLFDVPDNAGAKVTLDPLVAASRLQAETRIPTIMHLSASHRNLIATQSYLLGCWEAGLQAILAVTGDHPNVGDHDKYASRVNDVKSSVNLMRLIEWLNQGRLFNEAACTPTHFIVGGGFNPMRKMTPQLKWLRRKLEAGASFVYTQPLFAEDDVDRLLEATADIDVPFLVGILPLTSRRNAEFFAAGKIPGIIVPQEVLAQFEKVRTREDGLRLGLDLAIELLSKIKHKIRGIYVIPPFAAEKYSMVSELLRSAGVVSAAA